MTAALAAGFTFSSEDGGAYWHLRGCSHGHKTPEAGKRVTAIMRSVDTLTRERYRRVWHYVVCTETRAGHLKMRHRFKQLAEWRREHKGWIREQRLWAFYRAHPMPWCTWGPESGGSYTARNPVSSAGGKFQIIDSTWYANGGSYYADSHPAAAAPPLEQEKVGRNVLASQGLGAWVNC